MKEFYPKVSIIIPVYNGENFVSNAIDSALNQTYQNIEVIVVNDGSTDKTDEICNKYGDKIRYYKKKNGGVSSALNLGIKKMEGEYFSWLSHDDEYYPNKVEREIVALSLLENKNTIIYSNYDMMSENGKVYDSVFHNHEELQKHQELSILNGCLNGLTLLIPKVAFDECGLFDEKLLCTQDYDMWLRMLKKYDFYHICDCLTKTRIHDKQTTRTSPVLQEENTSLWINILNSISDDKVNEIYGSKLVFLAKMLNFFTKMNYYKMIDYCNSEITKLSNNNSKLSYNPLISVVIPVYNGANYIKNAINSVLEQTYKNYEVIVVNDGSTDNGETEKIVKSFGKKIKYYLKENGGVASALNYGISKAKGDYVSWLSHDDEYYPFKLQKQVEVLNDLKNKETILFSNFELINEKSEVFSKTQFDKRFSKKQLENDIFPVLKGCTNGCAMLIPKKMLLEDGGFDVSKKTTNDYIMWFKLFSKYPSCFIEDYLIKYRIHSNQDTRKSPVYMDECEEMWSDVFKNITPQKIKKLGYNELDFYSDFYFQMNDSKLDKTALLLKNKFYELYKKSEPSVSVIMPCYNSVSHLKDAIDSILNQRYMNFELICVDDNSTDDTYSILKEYEEKDVRVKVFKNNRSKGVSGAMNTGLDNARGKYITRMDSDDISNLERLKVQKDFLDNNSEYGVCTVNFGIIDKLGNVNSNGQYVKNDAPLEWQFLWTNPIPSAPCMYRKDILNGIRFNETFSTAEDYEFFTQLIKNNKFYFIEDAYYLYRIFDTSLFQTQFNKTIINSINVSREYYKYITNISNLPEYYPLLTEFNVSTITLNCLSFNDIITFINNTTVCFSKYYKWSEEDLKNVYKYNEELLNNFISRYYQMHHGSNSKEYLAVLNSTSWKITKPIRDFKTLMLYFKNNGLKSTLKLVYRKVFK